jgi:cellulose synthase/poly-beta-1,6-N-acetylglucosamine synthase-like glycosyltransferase
VQIFDLLYSYISAILSNPTELFVTAFLIVLLVELPFSVMIILGVLGNYFYEMFSPNRREPYYPKVSCVVRAYGEGEDILITLDSLFDQFYKGSIEVLLMVDGAEVNKHTLDVGMKYKKSFKQTSKRTLKIIPKWERGGLASSTGLGFRMSTGDIVVALDADTSCDNDMISNLVQEFADPNVIACSGTIKVRNVNKNILTKCQGLEYMFGIHLTRIALEKINAVNNVSGGYGSFRKNILKKTTLWRNGTAEDLDLTLRMQSLFKRHKGFKIAHSAGSIAHTDAPDTIWSFIKQRMRWDGDTFFIYIRRHRKKILPKYMGWKTFLFVAFSGIFLHTIQPMVIVLSLLYVLFKFSPHIVISIYFIAYLYYLVTNIVFYVTYIILVSERKRQDLRLWYIIFIMPFYSMFSKCVATVAILSEIFIRTHRDSTMAPVYVNKKVK